MKNILKLFTLSSLLIMLLWSCKKDEYKDYYLGGKPPVLSAITNTSGDSVKLNYADSSKVGLNLLWTNPNYEFTTGINSQDVNYQIEIDTAGGDFKSAAKKVISVSSDLSYAITEAELNDAMLNQLGLKDSVAHQLEIRVISTIGTSSAVPLISNVFSCSAVPYAIPPKVMPPASGELFITGDATPAGWMGAGDPPLKSQQFEQVSPTLYEIVINLKGGASYTFVPVYGNWNSKYSIKVKNDPDEIYGGDFQVNGDDILAPPASGKYKITVDFQRGKFTVVQQ